MANQIDPSCSFSYTVIEDSPIRSIFCLKKKHVSFEEFDQVEDCFILDFDPSEPVDSPAKLSHVNDDAQEISVVHQRGQVACRDFPHSRHLCVKFPFDETPHEDHCEQCYCYVCDSIAPCNSWKKLGHCNASEDDVYWKDQRKQHRPAPPQIAGTAAVSSH